jgi:hypothetical protein
VQQELESVYKYLLNRITVVEEPIVNI